MAWRVVLVLLLVVGFAPMGCIAGDAESDPAGDALVDELEPAPGKADAFGLPLRRIPGNVTVPTQVLQTEIAKVFRSAAELEATLKIPNPGIDFSKEWAVFYTPGLPALAPGSRAYVNAVSLSQTGLTIKVATELEHLGSGCAWRTGRPFTLMAVPIPADPPPYTRFYRKFTTLECGLEYHDGVSFTVEEAAGALAAANQATSAELKGAGITGAQASIIINGRTWPSLAAIAGTTNIGPATMTKLRTLGADF